MARVSPTATPRAAGRSVLVAALAGAVTIALLVGPLVIRGGGLFDSVDPGTSGNGGSILEAAPPAFHDGGSAALPSQFASKGEASRGEEQPSADLVVPAPVTVTLPDPGDLTGQSRAVYDLIAQHGALLETYSTLPSNPEVDYHSLSFIDDRGRIVDVWWSIVGDDFTLERAERGEPERHSVSGAEMSVMTDPISVHVAILGNGRLAQIMVSLPVGERFQDGEAELMRVWAVDAAADLVAVLDIGNS